MMTTGEQVRFAIALLVLFLLAVCIIILCFGRIPTNNKEVLMLLVGGVSNLAALVVGYYFGSSDGSRRKTELMGGDKHE